MPEKIKIQETESQYGIVYFVNIHIPQEKYDSAEIREPALDKVEAMMQKNMAVLGGDGKFRCSIHAFPTQAWNNTCVYISSTYREYTRNIAQEALDAFNIEKLIEE